MPSKDPSRPSRPRPSKSDAKAALRSSAFHATGGALEPRLSAQDGLLSINLLLFEICRYTPRQSSDVTAEHSSLAHIVRRNSGPVSLFIMCVLYAALARRIGLSLELIYLKLPPLLRAPRAPEFLLRLPAQGEQEVHTLEPPPCTTLYPRLFS